LPDGHADRYPGRKNLIPGYWVGSLDRLPTDVHTCHPIRVHIETTFDAMELPPVSTVASGDVAALGAGLTCVLCGNFNERYSEQFRSVAECVAEEAVGYPVCFSSALSVELVSSPFQVAKSFYGDLRFIFLSEFHDCFGKCPSVCSDIVMLFAAEPFQLQTCFAPMSCSVSVGLEFGAAVFVADLSKRNIFSQVELLQNPALSTHDAYSNAVAVLVDTKNISCVSWRWSFLLKQSEKTVATGHQDARDFPTIGNMLLKSSVSSILAYGQAEPLMVSSDAEDGVASTCRFEAEEPFVESYRWMVDTVAYPAPVPSVTLSLFNQLAGYAFCLVLLVDNVVEMSVGSRLRGFDCFKGGCSDLLEADVCASELLLFNICERQYVELQRLFRRYLPSRETSSQLFNVESYVKVFRNSSPWLEPRVSLR